MGGRYVLNNKYLGEGKGVLLNKYSGITEVSINYLTVPCFLNPIPDGEGARSFSVYQPHHLH